ncbi:hypothetical protein EDB80DRAFT_900269 [Ilyonectria destructans]|nr:hypothetical protein EDB80DRAFT_900269 [Ilyonectria destructans]
MSLDSGPYTAQHMPSYNGKFGWYDAQIAHLETMDNRQRWAQDKAALLEFATVKMNGMDIFTASRTVLNGDETGVRYAAKPGAVLHAVQLYTAVRQQQQQKNSVLVPEWPDIDHLLAMPRPQVFFVGAEPSASPKAHFKNYCMSRGISRQWWKGTREHATQLSKYLRELDT